MWDQGKLFTMKETVSESKIKKSVTDIICSDSPVTVGNLIHNGNEAVPK